MNWIKYIFLASIVRIVTQKKGRLWGAVIAVIVICVAALYVALRSREVDYPENPLSDEYRLNQKYLSYATRKEPPDFSEFKGGFFFSQIAIVKVEDFPGFTKKLRQELFKAVDNNFLFHSFTVGGMNIWDIDEPLLKASKRLRMYGRRNIEIVIVEPSTISSETQRILEKRGLKIRRIGNQLNNSSRHSER